MNTKRFDWLVNILGQSKAENLRSDLQKAADKADEIGLERKDASANAAPPPPDQQSGQNAPEGDPVHAAAQKLAQQVFDSVQGNGAAITVETLAAAIEEAMRPAVEGGNQEEQPMDTQQTQSKAEGEVKCPACGHMNPAGAATCEKCGAALPAGKSLAEKSLGEMINQMVTDQGEIAKSFVDQSTVIKAQGEKIEQMEKSILPVVEQLAADIKEMKERLGQRPRSASGADETVIDEDSEMGKALKTVMEKGTKGEELSFLGAPVKEMPK